MALPFNGLGISVSTSLPVEQIARLASVAEESGLDYFWIAESYHDRSAMVAASTVARATRSIAFGTGVISFMTRHPALIAMEAATLSELSGGRFILGLGAVRTTLLTHGVDVKSLQASIYMREALGIVRGLLRGKSVSIRGKKFLIPEPGISLGFKPNYDHRIFVGAVADRMLGVAGELADGLIMNFFSSPGYIRRALQLAEAGAKRSGRSIGELETLAYVITSVSMDRQSAFRAAVEGVLEYLPRYYTSIMDHLPSRDKLAGIVELVRAGKLDQARSLLDERLTDELATFGTPDEVISKMGRFSGTGLKVPVAFHILGPDREEAVRLLGSSVAPHLRSGK